MKRKIRLLSFTLAFMLMFAAMLAPVSQATYAVYSDNTDNETIRVRGSLQVNVYSGSTKYFSEVYSTLRFDSTGVGEQEIFLLDLTVTAIFTSSVSSNSYSITYTEDDVADGDYITATGIKGPLKGATDFTESQKMTKVRAVFTAAVHGTTEDYSPSSIAIFASKVS